ncbi:PH domain-containing protein [Streptomyces sp. H27-D2]|uniref:PH domain-containing protein n=1 Tax=Streptomyces sp. H27-D2 TaxID=3046304 RepID=UPI002DB76E9C|nr:PH domain-containing protein [Streptomyces sp. H27-D2]MEC4019536.1 PH domain-containing protein [Streptomyces sp. H27-D2]
MTSPDKSPTQQQQYADRVYRSPAAMAGGVLLLALAGWLGVDALIRGEGRVQWLALAGLLFAVPLVVAYTLRPAVHAGDDLLRVRNPFRTITLPWASVESVRASYSAEVFAGGEKFQMWAIPVSLRQRKRASRQATRAAADDPYHRTSPTASVTDPSRRAPADQAVDDLRELAERNARREGAQGVAVVRWAYEVLAPCGVGLVGLAVLFFTS